jgi:hypothetical protein
MALAFVRHPIDSYTDICDHQCIHGDNLWAQVYDMTGGNIGGWQENAQVHPRLFNMANDETISLVNRLLNDIQTLVDRNMADQLS